MSITSIRDILASLREPAVALVSRFILYRTAEVAHLDSASLVLVEIENMQAVRLHPNPDHSKPYSPANPAPSSALILDSDVPIPQALKPGEVLVKVEATTIIRDALTWPETYVEEFKILGNDFAGTVVAVGEGSEQIPFKPGDEVYGMTDAARAGTWAQYALVTSTEACLKPENLTWAQAAAAPLSGLTAYQALFEHAGLTPPNFANLEELRHLRKLRGLASNGQILVTGAAGGVGLYIVQLAKLTGLHVVAATSSNSRNKAILERLGVDEIVEYSDLAEHVRRYQTIIDTVGGKVLENCWSLVSETGTIVSIDSASYDFVQQHRKLDLARGAEKVKAIFFIVSPSSNDLKQLSAALEAGLLEPFVASVVPLAEAASAYENTGRGVLGRGKVVLTPQH